MCMIPDLAFVLLYLDRKNDTHNSSTNNHQTYMRNGQFILLWKSTPSMSCSVYDQAPRAPFYRSTAICALV